MIVLVPVSRFRVAYQVAKGRPYSTLERRVLEAASNGGTTLQSLSRTFRVHERLLVESVVTLVTAGWVAVAGGPEARFVLTAAGEAAVASGHDPVSVVVTAATPQTVVLDRVTGQLARIADARSYHRDDLGDVWRSAAVLRQRILRNSLDEAQVQKLLPRQTGEWVRGVGPITQTSRGRHFLPADVDLDTKQVRGLPMAWQQSLSGFVLECARDQRAADEEKTRGAVRPLGSNVRSRYKRPRFVEVASNKQPTKSRESLVPIQSSDIVVGLEAHTEILEAALRTARTSVAVVTPTASRASFESLMPLAASAVTRGVRVEVLVGQASDVDASDLVTIANRAGYQADNLQGRSLLRTGSRATGSGASLLLYDNEDEQLIAVVGEHDWLGMDKKPRRVGIRLSDPSICGDLGRAVASLWKVAVTPGGQAGSSSDRWKRLAGVSQDRAAMDEAANGAPIHAEATSVELLLDDEHAALLPETGEQVHVGRHVEDPVGGQGAARGLTLLLTGPGALEVRKARAQA